MKIHSTAQVRARVKSIGWTAALVLLNAAPVFAQGTTFNSTDLRTGISNTLAVIMMFGFVLGIAAVIVGGFAIRRGDVDQGKISIKLFVATNSCGVCAVIPGYLE